MISLKGLQRPAAFAIVCFCIGEFRTVRYSGSCGEQVVDFAQSMLVFVLPLRMLDIFTFVFSQELKALFLFDRRKGNIFSCPDTDILPFSFLNQPSSGVPGPNMMPNSMDPARQQQAHSPYQCK